jgi:hypothetical protein
MNEKPIESELTAMPERQRAAEASSLPEAVDQLVVSRLRPHRLPGFTFVGLRNRRIGQ